MYEVETGDGFIFSCDEYDDAVSLADFLYEESDREIGVTVSYRGQVVYSTDN